MFYVLSLYVFVCVYIAAETPVPLELPNQWLWDIVDEFVYQFQSYSQYRTVQKNKSDDEMERINANPQIWHVQTVLQYLHAIVEKSNINGQLIAFRDGTDIGEVWWRLFGTREELSCHSLCVMFVCLCVLCVCLCLCLVGRIVLQALCISRFNIYELIIFVLFC